MVAVKREPNKVGARSRARDHPHHCQVFCRTRHHGSTNQKYRHGHFLLNHVRLAFHSQLTALPRVHLFKIQSVHDGRISAESTFKPVGPHCSHSDGQRRQSDFVRCQSSRRRLRFPQRLPWQDPCTDEATPVSRASPFPALPHSHCIKDQLLSLSKHRAGESTRKRKANLLSHPRVGYGLF